VRPTPVRELELDLDAFEGPFDLLLTLLLKEAIEPREVDVAGIVLAFVERLMERDEVDLEACGEFLVLISALLELKARSLFPDEAAELDALEPEEAAEELARRLAEYRRMKEAAAEFRAGGIRGLVRRYGWKFVAAFVAFYLIRDVTLYILLPWLAARGLLSF